MQRTWQVPCDVPRRGWTLWADTIVEELTGAKPINGWVAVRVIGRGQHVEGEDLTGCSAALVRGMNVGRRTFLRADYLWPLTRKRPPWTCAHDVAGDRPWDCPACCVLAGAFGLADQPPIPGLPKRLFYLEEAVALWGTATGNAAPRLALDLWSARLAGQTWREFVADRAADAAEAYAETADLR